MPLMASTSEINEDPEVHHQTEGYRECVHTMGIRSCSDKNKGIAQNFCFDHKENSCLMK